MEDQCSAATPIGPSQGVSSTPPTGETPTPTGPSQNEPTAIGPNPSAEQQENEQRGSKRKEPEKRQTKQSEVWDHFVKLPLEETNGDIRAACKYCNMSYACDPIKHGTTSLKRHIAKCPKNPHKPTMDKKQTMLNYVSTGGIAGCSVQGRSLVSHVYNEKRCHRKLTEFIILEEQPFRFVEKKGFREFVHELEPRFPIPSRTTVTRDCWQLYLGEVKVLKQILKKCASRVCLTTDCWSSVQNFNYLCLTAHFIDPDWRLHKRILNFCMIEDHRGETIGKTIEKCLLEWGIDKVFTITMDNASSNDTALTYLKRRLKNWKGMVCHGDYMQVRCCAHVLNLVVTEGIREMRGSFDAIRNAVRYVRASPSRFQKFRAYAEAEKVDTKSLVCMDVSTRWNSTYIMLEAALKFQKVFDRMQEDDVEYRAHFGPSTRFDGPPTEDDWMNASIFIKFLKVFYDITLMFSSSISATSNSCFHQIA